MQVQFSDHVLPSYFYKNVQIGKHCSNDCCNICMYIYIILMRGKMEMPHERYESPEQCLVVNLLDMLSFCLQHLENYLIALFFPVTQPL